MFVFLYRFFGDMHFFYFYIFAVLRIYNRYRFNQTNSPLISLFFLYFYIFFIFFKPWQRLLFFYIICREHEWGKEKKNVLLFNSSYRFLFKDLLKKINIWIWRTRKSHKYVRFNLTLDELYCIHLKFRNSGSLSTRTNLNIIQKANHPPNIQIQKIFIQKFLFLSYFNSQR